MKRIITGLALGISALCFVFLSSNFLFQLGLYSLLIISSFELLSQKNKNNIFVWIIFTMVLVNILLVKVITEDFSRSFFFTVLLISVLTDIIALVFGRLIGRIKIVPTISPNKTLEGFISGLFLPAILLISLSFFILENNMFNSDIFSQYLYLDSLIFELGYFSSLIILTLCSLASIFGDLVASKAKRLMNVKDFSNLLPGHGGILDRIDSHLFCIPIFISFNIFL
jgi:phosphatidate cytidylyltransferase